MDLYTRKPSSLPSANLASPLSLAHSVKARRNRTPSSRRQLGPHSSPLFNTPKCAPTRNRIGLPREPTNDSETHRQPLNQSTRGPVQTGGVNHDARPSTDEVVLAGHCPSDGARDRTIPRISATRATNAEEHGLHRERRQPARAARLSRRGPGRGVPGRMLRGPNSAGCLFCRSRRPRTRGSRRSCWPLSAGTHKIPTCSENPSRILLGPGRRTMRLLVLQSSCGFSARTVERSASLP
jgi:hypothetical protein